MFSLDKELSGVLRMDGPVNRGQQARWQRRQPDGDVNQSVNASLNMSCGPSKTPSKTMNKSMNKTPSAGSAGHKTPKSGGKKTPGKGSKTPNGGDRFIPNRSTTQFELGQFIVTKENSARPEEDQEMLSPSKLEFQKVMNEKLNGDLQNKRIISYKTKAPNAPEGFHSSLQVLYSTSKTPASSAKKTLRNIPQIPERILDAPEILDDYYLNLLDWSVNNYLAVALGGSVYLWNATSGEITQLMQLDNLNLLDWSVNNYLAVALGGSVYLWNATSGEITQLMQLDSTEDYVGSVAWVKEGTFLAVGTSNGEVQLWDASQQKRLRNMTGHAARVGSLAWNSYILSSGSRSGNIHHHDVRVSQHHVGTLAGHTQEVCGLDGSRSGNIHHHDVRVSQHHVGTLAGHTQEVCGLEWSTDGRLLASGGNDNLLNVWSSNTTAQSEGSMEPLYTFSEHLAAVKAVAWCPWQANVLASGGGTSDRHIRFWNCNTGTCINAVDTKSQVCAILWSKEYRELISSHGFALNQLTIWKYPAMTKVAELTGHTSRVLHMAMSPDGSTVVSAGADETLRLWKCFEVDKEKKKAQKSASKTNTNTISHRATIR